MKRFKFLAASLAVWLIASVSFASTVKVIDFAKLQDILKKAKPGTIIQLPTGNYAGSLSVPAGVTLQGAGYNATTIDAGAEPNGIILAGNNAAVSQLSIISRGGNALSIKGIKGATASGLLIHGGTTGISLENSSNIQVENCIVDGSLNGIAAQNVQKSAIINNTITRTNSLGFSLIEVSDSAIFNNIVVDAGIAIQVSKPGSKIMVDNNLYLALFTGKFGKQLTRISLGPWRDISGGLDAHSVSLPVNFRDTAKGDYSTISTMNWNPAIATTSNWGVKNIGSFKAPKTDINGAKRPAMQGVGAVETATGKLEVVDGTFKITSDEGTKSAGVFAKDNKLIRYMFKDLPLKKGTYQYVLPSRTELGANIAAGDYEMRVVEGNLRWKYNKFTANNGIGTGEHESDMLNVWRSALGNNNNLILNTGWNERGENMRSKDLTTGKAGWSLPGNAGGKGLCRGADGMIYALRERSAKTMTVICINKQGTMLPWLDGNPLLTINMVNLSGLAELNGNLYTIASDGTVYKINIATNKIDTAFKVNGAFHPYADNKRQLIWMIADSTGFLNGVVTAYTPTGEVKYTFKGVENPVGVAVNGDKLAIASYNTGKIHYFDISNPAAPIAKNTIGRGDGPYGPITADRFWFQKGPYSNPREVPLDIDDAGNLMILDHASHPLVFNAEGKNLYQGCAVFGNSPNWVQFADDKVTRIMDSMGAISWTIDTLKGTSQPDILWGRPPGASNIGMFKYKDNIYGVLRFKQNDEPKRMDGVLIVRYDEKYVGRIVAFYGPGKSNLLSLFTDNNDDGMITAADGTETIILNTAEKSVSTSSSAVGRWMYLSPNGDIRSSFGTKWIFKGINDKGTPLYDIAAEPVIKYADKELTSPYKFSSKFNPASQSESVMTPDGGMMAVVWTKDSPNGSGLSNSGGIDIERFNKDGSLRWFLPMNDFGPTQGVKQIEPGLIFTSWGHQAEWIGLDEDGLSIGHLGFPIEAGWMGYWVDHPDQHILFKGIDGKTHVVVGDYMLNGSHWLTLSNTHNYIKNVYPLTITPERVLALAALPPRTTFMMAKSKKPKITITKLKEPLPIDGDLEKWRTAKIEPQIVITPATAGPGIKSANDCSAVIRVAYLGKDMYVQVLRFDDVVTFHQTIATGTHVQDTVEMMINGFWEPGFQFSVGRFSTDGDQIVRRRFYFHALQLNIPADIAPRFIKVLDNAEAVTERKLVEQATGEDLSKAKVIVTEYKLPIDERTWAGTKNEVQLPESGKGFWLGFMVDDNDEPGTDLQKLEVWPASYGTFSPKEDGAWAVFE
jgi:parallel beta-helix repeat protein